MRRLGEGLVAVLGDHAVVLQAHAANTGQVHAGLHGDNRANLDDILAAVEVGQLMNVNAHAVAQTMVVVITIAGIANDLLGKLENVVALDARMDGGDALLVRTRTLSSIRLRSRR